MSDKKARLSIDGIEETIELPVYEGTTGPDVIDVRSLVSRGVFTYDPGFVSTASCDSEITYIDGDHGILLDAQGVKLSFPRMMCSQSGTRHAFLGLVNGDRSIRFRTLSQGSQ